MSLNSVQSFSNSASSQAERSLADRLNQIRGTKSYKQFAEDIGANPETIRRYMLTGRLPGTVLSSICQRFGVSADWILFGVGPVESSHQVGYWLEHATPGQLLNAVAASLLKAQDRITAMEDKHEQLLRRNETAGVPGPETQTSNTGSELRISNRATAKSISIQR